MPARVIQSAGASSCHLRAGDCTGRRHDTAARADPGRRGLAGCATAAWLGISRSSQAFRR